MAKSLPEWSTFRVLHSYQQKLDYAVKAFQEQTFLLIWLIRNLEKKFYNIGPVRTLQNV